MAELETRKNETAVLGAAANNPSWGHKMAEILAELAKINALAEIDDPVQWQKEIRKDRPLPHRE
jgi:nicotinic acid mononucleotide adenylyltransferase